MPSSPPKVGMSNGLLSIDAQNSTMGEILSAVRKQTGAQIDVPSGSGSERVVAKLGPGNPRDVLQQLFTGSKFDYIIVGSPENPDAVQHVILTARGNAGPGGLGQPSPSPGNQPLNTSEPPDISPDNTSADEEIQQPPPDQQPTPEVVMPQGAQPGVGGPNQPNGQPKTPEQLLQELQQMQQQQRPPRDQRQPQGPPQQ